MIRLMTWRKFWLIWLTGWGIFAMLVLGNDALITDIVPRGIVDHQAAGNAARVDEIHASWAAAGALGAARWGMIFDFVFITFFWIGGVIGGRILWRDAREPRLKKLGLLAILGFFLFGLTDYIETGAQLAQLLMMQGSDLLAATAALMQPIKSLSFIVASVLLIAGLIWFAVEKREA